jgi:hypothetical protein
MKRTDGSPLLKMAKVASLDELRLLYLALARRLHPDRMGGSTEQMQKLNACWEAIKNGEGDGYEDTRSARAQELAWLHQDMLDEFTATADRWNKRLADLGIAARVTPASDGLFVLTMFDLSEDEIGTALDAKIQENTPF